MADAYLALDDTKNAMKAYKTALRLNPYRDDIHIKLGNLYFSEQLFRGMPPRIREGCQSEPQFRKHFRPGAGIYEYWDAIRMLTFSSIK